MPLTNEDAVNASPPNVFIQLASEYLTLSPILELKVIFVYKMGLV